MSDLIDRQDAIDTVTRYCNQYDLRELLADIEVLPSAEAVLKGTYEQVRWERDTALEQLKELGYSLGEKPRKSDLISRQKAINTAEKMYSVCDTGNITDYKDLVIEALEVLPSAERVGYWIPIGDGSLHTCSVCGEKSCCKGNYCTDCGARMVSENDNR